MHSLSDIADFVSIIVALLLISAAVLAITKRIKFPFAVALVLVGIAIGHTGGLDGGLLAPLADFDVAPGVILFVFLPTLIYESAFNLNSIQLRRNLPAVLTLAVPGLLLSTAIIGGIVWLLTPFDFATGLLIGAILSATDPVAVISLFRQLGTPDRLTVLVEGESLFNDATAIVVSRIILGVIAAGTVTFSTATAGTVNFFVVFIGGIAVGWLLARVTGWILGRVDSDPFIEITLTTILAYGSFLIAEEAFHVSGVMATVAAGITMGGWGRAKISQSISAYMENFWEYMAFVANALIFLLVGLRVELADLYRNFDMLIWVILAMLISRAVVVYTLVPLSSRLPGSEPVSRAYQSVMVWGGLRGAIALAIALSLEGMADADTIIALVTGAVLFTLLVQGLSIEPLVRRLGLDKPPLYDKVSRIEGLLMAKHQALKRIAGLRTSGLFSRRIAREIGQQMNGEIDGLQTNLNDLRRQDLDRGAERRMLLHRALTEEKNCYYNLFGQGHISERAYHDLCHSINMQKEALHRKHWLPPHTLHHPFFVTLRRSLHRFFDKGLGATGLPERLRRNHISRDYEESWGRFQSSNRVLEDLSELTHDHAAAADLLDELRKTYTHWRDAARQRLDSMAEQFPEFTTAMQERLAERLIINAQEEVIDREAHAGTIPPGVAATMRAEMAKAMRETRGRDVGQLKVGPEELLRKVPFFAALSGDDFSHVAAKLKPVTVPAGQIIIGEGEAGSSLFLIARGVVRVTRKGSDHEIDIATLLAGDFFGEMSLLHHEKRSATCQAVTPCALYELKRKAFDSVRAVCPAINAALGDADLNRRTALRDGKSD